MNNKLHEISHFKGEPPEDSYLQNIVKRKKKNTAQDGLKNEEDLKNFIAHLRKNG